MPRARLRVVFLPWHRRTQDQHGVAAWHRPGRRRRTEVADAARRKRTVVGQHGFAEQRLGDGSTENVGELSNLVPSRQRALPREHRDREPALRMAAAAFN
jgi:hypothetical protein